MSGLYKPRQAGTLKGAVARLVELVGGIKRAADLCGCSPSQMQRYTDEAEPDVAMRIDQVRTIETAAADPIVTRFLAAEQGCVLLPIATRHPSAFDRGLALVGKEFAELFGKAAESISDGVISAEEAARLKAECDEAMVALGELRGFFASVQSEPPAPRLVVKGARR